jgi:hypothetical protein
MNRRLAIFLVVLSVSCKPAKQQPAGPAAATGPQVRATVVTIRTITEPGHHTLTHTVVIVGDRARSTGEHDVWRLYDVKAKTVTFVDDVAATVRTESLAALLESRRTTLAAALPTHYPHAKLEVTGKKQPLQGVTATQSVITTGAYRRELWLGEHPAIPKGLFAMMQASDPPATPLAPMLRPVDEALLATRGFPLLDKAELPYGNKKMLVEHTVVSIAQQNVAAALLAVPKAYKDLTAKRD